MSSTLQVIAIYYILPLYHSSSKNSAPLIIRVSDQLSIAMYGRMRYLPDSITYHASLYVAIRPMPVLIGVAMGDITNYVIHEVTSFSVAVAVEKQ